MKMYILIRDDVPTGFAVLGAAHAVAEAKGGPQQAETEAIAALEKVIALGEGSEEGREARVLLTHLRR